MVNFEFQTMNVDITSDCLYGLFRLLNFLIGLYIIIQETWFRKNILIFFVFIYLFYFEEWSKYFFIYVFMKF